MAVPHHILIDIGSRWSSSLVLAEAELALHRWREDAEVLKAYGWGETRRRRFEALVDRLRTRHDAWAHADGGDTEEARAERTAARRWLDRAVSIIEASELDHPALGAVLASLPPPGEGAATLLDAMRAALTACHENRAKLDAEAADDRFYVEGASLSAAVAAGLGDVPASASDRAELIETLDGEVYLTIRGLNRAAGRAFAGDPKGRATRYVFQFLVTIQRGEGTVSPRRSEPPQKA
ncbi:MAG: hypothetical protein U0326_35745 [Polyangiales bacterium]